MKSGKSITIVVVVLALFAVITAFMSNASPYVTIAQAKTASGDRLHLAGDIIKPSVHDDYSRHVLTFQLRDQDGAIVTVEHTGEPPANMGEATKVVAIGRMKGDRFVSDQLLVKCPSKYEAAPGAASKA
jgi:cytochrome c-type biogenesis protein CcmE